IEALKNGFDYVYLHMEAPDECGHQGDLKNKIYSIELIDKIVVQYIVSQLESIGEPYSILVAPDHPTPIALKTHTADPVPFVIFRSDNIKSNKYDKMCERNAKASGKYFDSGESLIKNFIFEK
ncbi:MAG: phosphoglycerate mutase, partial [Clostridia bacterium]